MKRSALVVVVVLGFLGAADAVMLTINKVQDQVAGHSQSAVCQIVSAQGCQIAFDSAFADVGPIPLSLLAAVTYLMVIVLAFLMWRGLAVQFAGAALLLISVGAVVYSIVLAGYSWSQSSWCLYCIGLYVVNVALLVTTTWIFGQGLLKGVSKAVVTIVKARRQTGIAAVMFFVALFSSYGAYSAALSQATKGYEELASKLIDRALKAKRFPMPIDGAPSLGPADAKHTILKFSDFQCPHCKRLWKALEQLHERHPQDVRIVFRHYPLSNKCNPLLSVDAHSQACAAASAAVCAHQQGRFFELAGKMFENQGSLDADDLEDYAESVGIGLDAFKTCMANENTAKTVRKDVLIAASLGVEGTPTSLVNGLRFVGGLPFSLWKMVLSGLQEREVIAAELPLNDRVLRVQAALAQTAESVADSDIELTLKKKPDDRTAVVAFLDPGSELGNTALKALSELANRRPQLARISIYVVSQAPSRTAKRLVCAHLANRRDLLIAQGASNLKDNAGVQDAFKDLDECVAGDQPNSILDRHKRAAAGANVTEFPVTFVNGHRLVGAVSMGELEMMLGGIARVRE